MSLLNVIRALMLFHMFVWIVAMDAQAEVSAYWEIRNYYIDADDPKVEVFLVIDDQKTSRKEIVFFSQGEAAEVFASGQYRLSSWYMYSTYEYRFLIENKSIRIQKQHLLFSKDINDFIPGAEGWIDFKKIPIPAGKTIIPKAGATVFAKDLFSRDLYFKAERLNGDDVWALQRFLFEQGYDEIGDIDGWFGPNTEKAVKRFQKAKQKKETGIVDKSLWEEISGLKKENVNFFRGDYGG